MRGLDGEAILANIAWIEMYTHIPCTFHTSVCELRDSPGLLSVMLRYEIPKSSSVRNENASSV